MRLDIIEYCNLWIILYCGLASLQGVRNKTHHARLDTAVLLSCVFPESDFAHGDQAKVQWTQSSRGTLVEITRTGLINFSDPMDGRVIVFPNLCLAGNCSIRIQHLQPSDLGEYCCVLHNRSICSVVESSDDNAGEPNEVEDSKLDKWFFIGGAAGGGGAFCLLLIICFCLKFRTRDECTPDQTNTSTSVHHDAASHSGHSEEIVYENDDHDPNAIACVEIKPQQERTSISAGLPPPAVKPFYANQKEIDKQLAKRKRLKTKSLQYENPIYANSQEQLDQC
ncbi:hypothetical protein COCON_G00191940 [Conger conger]|uniref:Ig-like domain-containing protein n=1 Tax=Conger conger TaxID=82655 RepID=A0A9Q1HSD7_CONCO|nr:hypothetical protein COCON_G00191940 [Conger conger]